MAKMKRITKLMVVVMSANSLITPVSVTAQEFDAPWVKRSVSDTVQVSIPLNKWRPMLRARKEHVEQVSSYEYRSGPRWMTLNQEDKMLVPGITSSQLSAIMRIPRRDATMIFARYVPQISQLVIDAIKIEESIEQGQRYMTVYHSYFTPHHGERWALSRAYLTDYEMTDVSRAGRNPFASFRSADRSDPTFYNIGFDGAMVAVGLAMKYFHTAYSVISAQNLRMAQTVTHSGSFLRKKTTVKIDGYAQPTWFVGLPSTIQTWGTTAAICVVRTNTTLDPATGKNIGSGCPDNKLVAIAGMSFDQWSGGIMPSTEEHIYHWEKTKSGFTVLFFTLAIMAASFFVGPELYAAASGGGLDATVISGWQAAGAAGGAYAGGSLVLSSGPSSWTDVRAGVFGSIGDGTHALTDSGSQQVEDAKAILENRQIHTTFDPKASCGEGGSLCSTQAGMTLITPDPSGAILNGDDQTTLRQSAKYCREQLHLKGDEFTACVVPRNPPVDIP